MPDPALRPAPRGSLWGNFSFMLMWVSVAASGFGDRLVQLAFTEMLGFRAEGAEAASVQAGVLFFFFLPYLLFGPLGGWLADTLPRKWIMLGCDEGRALLLLLATAVLVPLGANGGLPSEHHWQLYALMFMVGACAAVFAPTRNATVPQVVPRENLQSANAIILGITTIAALVGVIAGGQVIERGSVSDGILVAMLLFLVSGTLFAFLRVRPMKTYRPRQQPGQLQRIVQGMRYIRQHRRVAWLVFVYTLFWAAASIFIAALAAFVRTHYETPTEIIWTRYTLLQGATGLGMLAAALLVAWLNTRRESAWVAMASLAGAGMLLAVMMVNVSYPVGLVLAFFIGLTGNTAVITVSTLTQVLSANYIRGRVFGARELLSTAVVVLVHLTIWQMPQADRMMVPALAIIAAGLVLAGGLGLIIEMPRGPLPSWKLSAARRVMRLFCFAWHQLRFTGKHHVPHEGPVILAANHTTGLDPFLIQVGLPRLVRWVMLERYRYRLLEPLWREIEPVMLTGEAGDLSQTRRMLQYLKQGEVLGIFPEGQLQRDHRELQPFQAGIGMLARRSKAPIVPIWITGTPRSRSMLVHFFWPSRSHVLFGEPYHPDEGWSDEQVAEDLRARMLALAATVGEG